MGSSFLRRGKLSPLALGALVAALLAVTATCSVTYDHKAIVIGGKRRVLFSGSIHYPRSTPEVLFPPLTWLLYATSHSFDGSYHNVGLLVCFRGSCRCGLTSSRRRKPAAWRWFRRTCSGTGTSLVLAMYVDGRYNFEGRYDLVRFVKLAKEAGLYVHLRIGPYICAEWNFGGFPVWLKYVPGIKFRTDNGPFKAAMAKFTDKIVSMMKAEGLYEGQGGPIILSQIENEYGPLENYEGAAAKSYSSWAAKMAVGLETGVPWVMCKQDDAPDPVINTCNGFYCDYFSPNKPYKPTMWTESWTGWFTAFGGAVPHRPAEDLAFSVARFIQKGGTFVNYYMYHGGTNFERTAGGPFVSTSYDYDAPIDEYGLLRQPKWGHLRNLHKAIKMCEPSLVAGDPTVKVHGRLTQSHVFRSKMTCAAFLSNYDSSSHARVFFNGMSYDLPPWSISILPDCKTVVYNTARVSTTTTQMKMQWVGGFNFQSFKEWDLVDDRSFTHNGLLEQISVTRDTTDYMWYTTYVNVGTNEGFLKSGQYPTLTVMSSGHSLHVFVNGGYYGNAYGGLNHPKVRYSGKVKLSAGSNKISILSVTIGLPNAGEHFETWNTGILGPVTLSGLNKGTKDLSRRQWAYRVGLKGESMNLHTVSGSSTVEWRAAWPKQALTWYKAFFNAPGGNEPLALDMDTMGKGQIWVNGKNIGCHWPGYKASGSCGACSYAGTYNEKKCSSNCGESSQRWYRIPRSWLNPMSNLLVIFEEWGGEPKGIALVKRTVGRACAVVSEQQPSMALSSLSEEVATSVPKAQLSCAEGQKIKEIKFVSFGTPQGLCGSFLEGSCHAQNSTYALQESCIGQQTCSADVSPEVFGGDPCPNTLKNLSVEAICE